MPKIVIVGCLVCYWSVLVLIWPLVLVFDLRVSEEGRWSKSVDYTLGTPKIAEVSKGCSDQDP